MLISSKHTFPETSTIVFDQIFGYNGLARLTHTINCHSMQSTKFYYTSSHVFLIISQLGRSHNFYYIFAQKLKFQEVKRLPISYSCQGVALHFKAIISKLPECPRERANTSKGLNVSFVPYEFSPGISPSPRHLRVI